MIEISRGSAAAQGGEALPHRRAWLIEKEAAPPAAEAGPRRDTSNWTLSVSHRLTARCGGEAAEVAIPVIRFGMALLLLLALAGSNLSPGYQKGSTGQLNAITSYTKSIDQFTKRHPRKRRIFGMIPGEEGKPDKWAEFKTVRQEVQANLDDSVYVWRKDGKVVVAQFTFTSSSGDWYHYVSYYFRADGTLAKVHAQLNTFAAADGGMSVVRDKFFGSSGKLLHTATRYLDLKSQKPRKRGDFMDQPIPAYQTVRDLPFYKLL
jgi:hypothetical protein